MRMNRWFRRAVAVCAVVCVIGTPHNEAQALPQDIPEYVKIGLVSRESNEVIIHNKEISVGVGTGALLHSAGGFTAAAADAYYVRVGAGYPGYSGVIGEVDYYKNLGFRACAGLEDSIWYVYMGGYTSLDEAQAISIQTAGTVLQPNDKRIVLSDGITGVVVFDSSETSLRISDAADGLVKVGDRTYRGELELVRNSGKKLTMINVVTMDEYLYSAVTSEMPSGWHIEALKAQSVAARSYTISRITQDPHKGNGYMLCDSDHCQVYLGAGNESENGRLAVDSTTGILAYYDGVPINAVFCSSSGGATDDSENVWTDAVPYLRGVPEINEEESRVWARTFTYTELTAIAAAYGAGIGTVKDMRITKTGATGRVLELEITGNLGVKTLVKEEVRNFFAGSTGGRLDSRNFTIQNGVTVYSDTQVSVKGADAEDAATVNELVAVSHDLVLMPLSGSATINVVGASGVITGLPLKTAQTSAPQADTLTLVGSGWGHGVGMSQYGAKGMAEIGYTFDEILRYYYTGITVH